jgi:hypothetical protein
MRRLEVSSEAEVEIFEAAHRYERERIGLGVRFETQRGFEVDLGAEHATKDTRKTRWNVGEIACRI